MENALIKECLVILYQIYPYVYVIILLVFLIFILILAILILLVTLLRNKTLFTSFIKNDP